jgi:hypothetical protein
MPAPTIDRSQSRAPAPGPARRRSPVSLLAVALALAVASTGVAIALAMRPVSTASTGSTAATAPAGAAASPTTAGSGATQVAAPQTGTNAQPSGQGQGTGKGAAGGPTASTAPRPVLADGSYDGFVRSVDVGGRRIVVDLVQVFEGQAAEKAAAEDGKPGWGSGGWYVRNQNPRLRTLAAAPDVRAHFIGTCEQPAAGPSALSGLAKQIARTGTATYYHFTVEGGLVRSLQEKQTMPAC